MRNPTRNYTLKQALELSVEQQAEEIFQKNNSALGMTLINYSKKTYGDERLYNAARGIAKSNGVVAKKFKDEKLEALQARVDANKPKQYSDSDLEAMNAVPESECLYYYKRGQNSANTDTLDRLRKENYPRYLQVRRSSIARGIISDTPDAPIAKTPEPVKESFPLNTSIAEKIHAPANTHVKDADQFAFALKLANPPVEPDNE